MLSTRPHTHTAYPAAEISTPYFLFFFACPASKLFPQPTESLPHALFSDSMQQISAQWSRFQETKRSCWNSCCQHKSDWNTRILHNTTPPTASDVPHGFIDIFAKQPKERNWLAVHAFQRSGAGAHTDKKKPMPDAPPPPGHLQRIGTPLPMSHGKITPILLRIHPFIRMPPC